jgi:hypothetical protein
VVTKFLNDICLVVSGWSLGTSFEYARCWKILSFFFISKLVKDKTKPQLFLFFLASKKTHDHTTTNGVPHVITYFLNKKKCTKMTYHYIHIVLPIALPRLRRQTGKKKKKQKKGNDHQPGHRRKETTKFFLFDVSPRLRHPNRTIRAQPVCPKDKIGQDSRHAFSIAFFWMNDTTHLRDQIRTKLRRYFYIYIRTNLHVRLVRGLLMWSSIRKYPLNVAFYLEKLRVYQSNPMNEPGSHGT